MKGDVIIVDIAPDGTLKADVQRGPGGAGCVKELIEILDGTGVKESDIKHKREYFAKPAKVAQKGKVSQ